LNLNPKQRVIFASAYVQDTLVNSVKHLKRVVELMQKPFGLQQVIDTVEDMEAYEALTSRSVKEMNRTTKQYYSRISGLLNAGLIKRHKGKYSLTLLGKVEYDSHMTIGKTLAYYWKLKAIESIEISSGASLPEGELTQLINALIDNHQIKDILMKTISVPSTENKFKDTSFNSCNRANNVN
ncbi:MAG: hypothetical protein ACR2IS_16375, partial [Nitrososphaeraceae archaeon]